jgi:hypothetical protein
MAREEERLEFAKVAAPFVVYADAVGPGWHDDTGTCLLFKQPDDSLQHKPTVTLGDCRRLMDYLSS